IAHLIVDNAGDTRHTEFETDRRNFIGRGRSLADASAFDPGATLSGSDGFMLDAVMSRSMSSLMRSVKIGKSPEIANGQ
ncbi:hypothetical protein AB9E29_33700, partial [Rhizobium leguminosarum]|uniref:hypothetical protein n=1 Tax=Rhizobium leguminosarum TaxID=384 RepID=UPI003F9E6700